MPQAQHSGSAFDSYDASATISLINKMNILESIKPRLGVVLVSELLGTSLLVATFLLTIVQDVLTNAVMFFICVLLTYTTSYA